MNGRFFYSAVLAACSAVATALLVTTASSSGNLIEAVPYSSLTTSSFVFTDRTLTFADTGSYDADCFYIRGGNDDKDTAASSVQWTLGTNEDSIVYLDFWDGQESYGFSSWSAGWSISAQPGIQFGGYGPGTVYEQSFVASSILLYGNDGSALIPNKGTYVAFVCPQNSATTSSTVTYSTSATLTSTFTSSSPTLTTSTSSTSTFTSSTSATQTSTFTSSTSTTSTSITTTSTDPNVMAFAASGGPVAVVYVPNLNVGDLVYSDRSFTFLDLGSYRSSCYYLRGPNNDKNTEASSVQWTILTLSNSTIYLDFWQDQDTLGFTSWSSGWKLASETGVKLMEHTSPIGPGMVYKKNFTAGTVQLYGNDGNGVSTYIVFVCDQETTTTTTSLPPPFSITAYSVAGNFMTVHLISSLHLGDPVFTDRTLTLTSLGDYDSDCIYIRGPNDDLNTPAGDVQWVINLSAASTVYLDFWDDQYNLGFASWNTGWQVSGRSGITFATYGPGVVYRKDFGPGSVFLYGNAGENISSGTYVGTYVAIACPEEPATTTSQEPLSLSVIALSSRLIETVSASSLQVGDPVFTDRTVTFSSLGSYSNLCFYVRGPNDDQATPFSSEQWLITSGTAATVYLDFWNNQDIYGFQEWNQDWLLSSETGIQFSTYGPGRVYQKNFPAGNITLYGNTRGNSSSTAGIYLAYVCPVVPTLTSTTSTATSTTSTTQPFRVQAVSGRHIELVPVASIQVGDPVFTDRTFSFNALGSYDSSCYFLRGPNNDKMTSASSVQWILTSYVAATVYLDFWSDQDRLGFASWSTGWAISSQSGLSLLWHGAAIYGPGIVYEKHFDGSGDILLFGNDGKGVDNYAAVICADDVTLTTSSITSTATSSSETHSSTSSSSQTHSSTSSSSQTHNSTSSSTETLSSTSTTRSSLTTTISSTTTYTSSSLTATVTTISQTETTFTATLTYTNTRTTITSSTTTTTYTSSHTRTSSSETTTTMTRTTTTTTVSTTSTNLDYWFSSEWIVPQTIAASTLNWALCISAASVVFLVLLCLCCCVCRRCLRPKRQRQSNDSPPWGHPPSPDVWRDARARGPNIPPPAASTGSDLQPRIYSRDSGESAGSSQPRQPRNTSRASGSSAGSSMYTSV
eukprot:TRINITY_DN5790_c0_g1_i1.p1 TRINITY_DN5790_c0_g1~~TRINITY_DN5790_c0_g1_i1.p1  ORF type:complete len:1136 (-),score=84.03 TRINITY_DN5790_c0_g1_i1:254-3661(-)